MAATQDLVPLIGHALIEIIRDGKHGPEVIQRIETFNLVVNSGKKQLVRRACGLQTDDFDQFRIGTSGAAAASNQTNVLSPVAATFKTADSKSLLSGTRTLQLVVSYISGASSISATDIQEVCILNQHTTSGGSALSRAVFTPVTKTEDDKLKITYSLRVT